MGGSGAKKPPPQPSPTSLFCVPQNKEAGEGVTRAGAQCYGWIPACAGMTGGAGMTMWCIMPITVPPHACFCGAPGEGVFFKSALSPCADCVKTSVRLPLTCHSRLRGNDGRGCFLILHQMQFFAVAHQRARRDLCVGRQQQINNRLRRFIGLFCPRHVVKPRARSFCVHQARAYGVY